jgi:hypothetical protein
MSKVVKKIKPTKNKKKTMTVEGTEGPVRVLITAQYGQPSEEREAGLNSYFTHNRLNLSLSGT